MDQDRNKAYLLLVRKWKHDEDVTCAQLAQVVSDSLLIKIQCASTITNMWDIIITEFNRKGCMVDLHQRMMERQVSKMDDICTHLDDMALTYKGLSSMGAAIHDKEYLSMILMSLPDTYTTHLETLADVAISSGRMFTAHNFISKMTKLTDK